MRQIYLDILRILVARAESGDAELQEEISQLLIQLNHEGAPVHDQDLVDFMTEFYIFLTFGYELERSGKDGAIKDWADLHKQLEALG